MVFTFSVTLVVLKSEIAVVTFAVPVTKWLAFASVVVSKLFVEIFTPDVTIVPDTRFVTDGLVSCSVVNCSVAFVCFTLAVEIDALDVIIVSDSRLVTDGVVSCSVFNSRIGVVIDAIVISPVVVCTFVVDASTLLVTMVIDAVFPAEGLVSCPVVTCFGAAVSFILALAMIILVISVTDWLAVSLTLGSPLACVVFTMVISITDGLLVSSVVICILLVVFSTIGGFVVEIAASVTTKILPVEDVTLVLMVSVLKLVIDRLNN